MLRSVVVWALLAAALAATGSEAAAGSHHRAREARQALAALPLAAASAVGPQTSVPYGWADFCRRYVGECDTAPLPAETVALTVAAWRQIDRINSYVNSTVQPVSDLDHWGVLDQWDYPTDRKGDCEDYALLKRRMLMAAGLPRQALLITVVRDLHDEGHAVLTVVTDHGDFVLDNISPTVRSWTATGYRFVKRQSQEDPNVWLSLRSDDVPAVAATRSISGEP